MDFDPCGAFTSPTAAFAAVLEQLLATGFQLPISFAAISSNESFMCGTYRTNPEAGGLSCEIPVMHSPEEMTRLPINLLFVDSTGEAARVVFQETGRFEIIR